LSLFIGGAVDPEIKKKLDLTIQEARQALEVINEGANNLAAEERNIRAQEAQFKEKFVCRFLFGRQTPLTISCLQDALDGRKKTINNTKRHLATLSAKIGISITLISHFPYLIVSQRIIRPSCRTSRTHLL